MVHKLRHGLSEDEAHPLSGFIEADETFIGGRGDPASPGRSTDNPDLCAFCNSLHSLRFLAL